MNVSIGSVIYSAVRPIFKIYFIIGTGYLLAKLNILTVDVTRNISDMIVIAILPSLAFNKIVSSIGISDLKSIGVICLSAVILYLLGAFCSLITIIATPVPRKWYGGAIAAGMFPNISDLPIAYIQTLDTGLVFTPDQGNKGIAYVCIFLATFLLVVFNLGGFRLIEYDFKDLLVSELPTEEPDPIPAPETTGDNSEKTEDLENRAPLDITSLLSSANSEELQNNNYVERIKSEPRFAVDSGLSPRVSRLSPQSSAYTQNTLLPTFSRNLELRTMPSQNVKHVINEYSRANNKSAIQRLNTITRIATTGAGGVTAQDLNTAGSSLTFVQKYKLHWLVFLFQNFLRPASLSLILSLAIALIPWLKALFVHTTKHIPDAPDKLPPLSFIMDYTAYVGQASVPLGLLLLGTTISRLSFRGLDKKFFISAGLLTVLKLCIVPIIGVTWATKLRNIGWLQDEMMYFVIVITWALPSATTQFYFTAANTAPDASDTTQMDCLSIYLLLQYLLLMVSLPFVVTYIIEKQLRL